MITVLFFVFIFIVLGDAGSSLTSSDLLSLGDSSLASEDVINAIDYYKQAISLLNNDDDRVVAISIYTNLGTALSSLGNRKEAADSYRAALRIHSEAAESFGSTKEGLDEFGRYNEITDIAAQASFYLGMVLQDSGELHRAAHAYDFAGQLDPYHWASFSNLGALLQDDLRDIYGAIKAYHQAYKILTTSGIVPTDAPPEPRYILSQLKYRIGMALISSPNQTCASLDNPESTHDCKELAANSFLTASKYDPGNEGAKHMLASITADASIKRASNAYVEALFENYAVNFEKSLVKDLKYDGYKRLRNAFNRAFGDSNVPLFDKVIDAGCGTGLVGQEFRNISLYLVGVDLSSAIIEQANLNRPGLYNETKVGDIIEIFRELKPVSLIVAGDSYIYFGDLNPLLESVSDSLVGGGYAAFTLEDVDAVSATSLNITKPGWRWMLTPSGRFAHNKEYVKTLGGKHSLHTMYYEHLDGFRYENGVPVRGHIFVMKKMVEQEL